jgi:hypothetical protein
MDTIHIRSDFHKSIYDYWLNFSKLSHFRTKFGGGVDGPYCPQTDTSGILSGAFPYTSTGSSYFSIRKSWLENCDYYYSSVGNLYLDSKLTPIAGNHSLGCGLFTGGECFQWNPITPTDFPPSSANVREAQPNPNILQVHLSSDPVSANSDLIVTLPNQMNVRMEFMDILGHIISSDEKMFQAGINKLPINSSALSSGIYICRLQAGGEVVSVRFVKE